MDISAAEQLAIQLINKHKLTKWKFKWTNGKIIVGLCKFKTKTITLSKYWVTHLNEDEVQNTILHEIAHALVGIKHGHDNVWKRKAIKIGCNGDRCHSASPEILEKMKQEQHEYRCSNPECGIKFHRHRKLKSKRACSKCCKKHNSGLFSDQYLLVLVENE